MIIIAVSLIAFIAGLEIGIMFNNPLSCTRCKQKLPNDSLYCPNCGKYT